ncbi:aldehyde oxidase GLOX-like [Zingiber officinale]|uniref:Aldehyde oxidase GLOX n=1 Tax=Zingiber officinale TaxID=94328 RepID=A0A8J5FDF2_ZINOF|nr:aldehyde oxidase GLOX-like [Zingiber officinale]KAG6485694.1 hypothetical protein ZIOFF_054258 [Zingiber officinale]
MRSLEFRTTLPLLFLFFVGVAGGSGGQWVVLQRSIGVSAMHMQLLHNDRVVVFDRTDFGRSNLSLPSGGGCRRDPHDRALRLDCTAHSAEYEVATNSFRPLTISTDTWCSSGTIAPDGSLVQTGGFNDGERAVRTFRPCLNRTCDWVEVSQALAVRRWYATNHIVPDGRAIIVGGRRQFSYEFYPKTHPSDMTAVVLPFLRETRDAAENNLYPFVHLNLDGHLFIFANNRAILLDYTKNSVVRTYPTMPGGHPRNYPSSGSSVLLPLEPSPKEAEVLICGGAPAESYARSVLKQKPFLRALDTCGRLKITDAAPSWTMETMPVPRVMGDMVLLPTGEVLTINGAKSGTAGWELAGEPALTPVLYRPGSPPGTRFNPQSPSTTPRLYHSAAVLLRDGRVLVGGGNPHISYDFYGVEFPTELSLEAFSPPYLSAENLASRPRVMVPVSSSPIKLSYGERFILRFTVAASLRRVRVTMVAPAFATHSFSMSQRLLVLETKVEKTEGGAWHAVAVAPASGVVAPSGYYMVYVVNGEVPSEGVWCHIHSDGADAA